MQAFLEKTFVASSSLLSFEFYTIGLIYNLNMSIKGDFWPLRRKGSNISI